VFEYLDDSKNKKLEQITLKWDDRISHLQWGNPGIERGSGNLVEVLCGIVDSPDLVLEGRMQERIEKDGCVF
jgi:hypothetical protein